MAKLIKCPGCNGKGLFPWCHVCFKKGQLTKSRFDAEVKPVLEERERVSNMSQLERLEHERMKGIERAKYLDNCKSLKRSLTATIRARKLLTGKTELDAIINDILAEVIQTIHDEIDLEVLTSTAQVIARFNALVETPDYGHLDFKINGDEITVA